MKKVFALVLFVTMFCWLAWAADAAKELDAAAHVLQTMTSSKKIPASVLKDARCIAVIPKMTKAGLIIGGKHGDGAVSCRTASGWSAPAFISMTGGSVGLEAGAEHESIVLLMNQKGEQELKNGHWDLKAGASAAGPNGESGVSEQTGWKAPVLSYSNGKGVFAGADIGGSKIDPDKDTIHNLYGETATFQSVLSGQVKAPAAAQQFLSALRHAAGTERASAAH
ncbi:MAG TPA: lipid-binding SYLF domain-containing protein [Terriglobales bacterium]|nr:lipid-binding SYLF domain-containing protein [Terriglobales bacterium]